MSDHLFIDLIGVPFVDLGRDPKTGLDCWGAILECGRRTGKIFPDYAKSSCLEAALVGKVARDVIDSGQWERVPASDVQLGDIVSMSTDPTAPGASNHFGFMLTRDRFLHTMQKHNLIVSRLSDNFFKGKVLGFFRWRG